MGSKKSIEPARVSPQDTAQQTLAARQATDPASAQLSFDLLSSPEFGITPLTQLQEDTRRQVFGGESDVRDQLLQNILSNLQSPTGITPDQQQAITERRGLAQDELVGSLRNRANLSGNLFGGRAANTEERAVSELQQGFAESDIAREERARLNAIQAAIPALQTLFPGIGIQAPQFQSTAPTGGQVFQGAVGQSNLEAQLRQQQQASQDQLLGSLFQGLGQGASAFAPTPTP